MSGLLVGAETNLKQVLVSQCLTSSSPPGPVVLRRFPWYLESGHVPMA